MRSARASRSDFLVPNRIRWSIAAANRDRSAFVDPDRFDIDRIPTGHNINFGYGIHSCLGAALARIEGQIALDVMLDLMPEYEVDTTGLRRVAMANVAGWANVPVNVAASPSHG